MRECVKRRVLNGLTVAAWGAVAELAWASIQRPDSVTHRVWFWIMLGMACCLFTASLFASLVAPMERVWQAGYQAGQRSSDGRLRQPVIAVIDNWHGSVTSEFRTLHTDS